MQLVWSSENYTIYKDTRIDEHVLYKSGESVFSAVSFDEVYGFSLRHRGLR